MEAEELLRQLLKDIQSLSDTEYEKLMEITESKDFISLSERQVRFWLGWGKEKAA